MKGQYKIIVGDNKLKYNLTINRNITIIRGNSGTGKTTLVEMIRRSRSGNSFINIQCDVECDVIVGDDRYWDTIIETSKNTIFFLDEDCEFVSSHKFASLVKNSNNYFVIITRHDLHSLPYSINEIYEFRISTHYAGIASVTLNEMVRLYDDNLPRIKPSAIITEDSNSGYEFFKGALKNIEVISAKGKSKIKELILTCNKSTLIIVDGAAFGPNLNNILKIISDYHIDVYLYAPESFEWLILRSDLLYNRVKNELEETYNYADSLQYFSWKQYYTWLLRDRTNGTKMAYDKNKLNQFYLSPRAKKAILETVTCLDLDKLNNKEDSLKTLTEFL